MAIWAQVRDLPFERKTESMGWTLGDQLGEVLEVSHRNHVIVEKFLRVRVEVLLHEPLKSTVEFTPLGSSKIVKYDVRYEKLPLYYECCGIVGHTSERFCNIPSDKRVASYPKNLSVEAYWKGQGASKRALMFGSSSRGEKASITGIDINKAAKTMDVVKVASAVSALTVSEKEAVNPAKSAAMAVFMLVQEGRDAGAPSSVLLDVATSQVNQARAPSAPANLGQEGQGLAMHTALHGQEGHATKWMHNTNAPRVNAAAAAGNHYVVQKNQEKTLVGWPKFYSAGAPAASEQPIIAAEF
ncbi:hypothetical protein VPH35_104200 [Triticum aestivum]